MTSDTGISTGEIRRIARDEAQEAFAEDPAGRTAAIGSTGDSGVFAFLSRKAARLNGDRELAQAVPDGMQTISDDEITVIGSGSCQEL
jgi:hypothetical protein